MAHRTVPPHTFTPRGRPVLELVDRLFRESGGNVPCLDEADCSAISRLLSSTREALSASSSQVPPALSELESGLRGIVGRSDAEYAAERAAMLAAKARREGIEASMRSEDAEIDENGAVIARDMAKVGGVDVDEVEPRLATGGGKLSAADVIAHNKAVAQAESRSDSTPPVGAEAVARRVVPGVPDMPGARLPGGLYDSIAEEARAARQASSRPYPVPKSLASDMLEGGGYERSDEVMEGAKARNFGRKQ